MHRAAINLLKRRTVPSAIHTQRVFSALSSTDFHDFRPAQFLNLGGQQVRFRRHDRASAFSKPRPKTKKQRQTYNRKIKRIEDEKQKHSAPGARAGPRRQFIRERWQNLLDQANGKELVAADDDKDDGYGIEDAIMEDLLGNTAHLSSQPTPEPVYLGHMHQQYYDMVSHKMEQYREAVEAIRQADAEKSAILNVSSGSGYLPSDEDISKVLRAFRDRNGTRSRPIGIAIALEHLLKDLGVPIFAFGEYTYTTLMTCCRTPNEARRIMKLMTDQQHPVSSYSWSILVDIHAKLGDFESCANIVKEMAHEGVPPPQAAYTSLLAACYRTCNDGRIPHKIRAKAGEIGWNHWQEMRIVGIDADSMAYGAIIRLCAARGQAERAINLLEEMHRFDVKPTSLCFSGALRAVARSHEIGVRFERGSSRKQLRRELFTAHHGKMARQIVIMAENAEVEQDESFVSALMLCSAAAGDSATTKAVYLAAEVRNMDHLRTIGPTSNFNVFLGRSGNTPEHLLSSMLDQSSDTGDEDGYFGNSLINPDASTGSGLQVHQNKRTVVKSFGEREYGKDTRALSALLKACGQAMGPNNLGTMWAGSSNGGYLCENSLRMITTRWEPSYTKSSIPDELSTKVGISSLRRYDENDRDEPPKKGAARKKFRGLYLDDDAEQLVNDYGSVYQNDQYIEDDDDISERIGQRREKEAAKRINEGGTGHAALAKESLHQDGNKVNDFDGNKVNDFDDFFRQLKEEAADYGFENELTVDDAREMYELLQEDMSDEDASLEYEEEKSSGSFLRDLDTSDDASFGADGSHGEPNDGSAQAVPARRSEEATIAAFNNPQGMVDSAKDEDHNERIIFSEESPDSSTELGLLDVLDDNQLFRIRELQAALPGLPISRITRVAKTFEDTLGYPSLLSLVPLLRESLPDHVSLGWLRRMNTRNADFVLQKAEEENVVDVSLLNSMLQTKANACSLLEAQNFHRDEFRRYNLKPTAYSDRIVIQMLIENNRLSRALDFKHRIEDEKRTLDLPSYGSLIDYCSRHDQLGSAIMFLNESVALHGSPPSEKYLSSTRVLARQLGMQDALNLTEILGKDPTDWLKHGEKYLKREKSKKGRRDVHLAYNRILG